MKKQDKTNKATAAKLKTGAKVATALTGPGLLTVGELNDVSAGNQGGTGRVCAVGTTARC